MLDVLCNSVIAYLIHPEMVGAAQTPNLLVGGGGSLPLDQSSVFFFIGL